MVAAANNDPYYGAVTKSTLINTIEPIRTFAGTPPAAYQQQAVNFASQFNAVNTMVYAYAGALLFVAFLAEMRTPMDFWKGLFCAQAFIGIVYLLFGVFVSPSRSPMVHQQQLAGRRHVSLTPFFRSTHSTANTQQARL